MCMSHAHCTIAAAAAGICLKDPLLTSALCNIFDTTAACEITVTASLSLSQECQECKFPSTKQVYWNFFALFFQGKLYSRSNRDNIINVNVQVQVREQILNESFFQVFTPSKKCRRNVGQMKNLKGLNFTKHIPESVSMLLKPKPQHNDSHIYT